LRSGETPRRIDSEPADDAAEEIPDDDAAAGNDAANASRRARIPLEPPVK